VLLGLVGLLVYSLNTWLSLVVVAAVVVVVAVVPAALGQMLWVKTPVEHPQRNPRSQ
jgi:hypothetical protein